MTTTTQHISPNPALDFANAVLEETDGAREIIYMLHDIAQGVRENATTNDRMKASGILMDRGLGKCPKQPPVLSPVEGPVLSPVEGPVLSPVEGSKGPPPARTPTRPPKPRPALSLLKKGREPALSEAEGLPKSTAPFTIPSDLHQVRSPKGIRLHP